MVDDAQGPSLGASIRALEDKLRDLEAKADRGLALAVSNQEQIERNEARIRDAARLREIVTAGEPPPPSGPRHKRPHHLRVIPGGLAAVAPVAFLFHDGLAVVATTAARWVWQSKRAQMAAAVVALAVGAAGTVPAIVHPDPEPAAPLMHWRGHGHDRPPARSLYHQAPQRLAAPPMAHAVHHQRRRRAVAVLPTLAPSPSPSPSPSPAGQLPTPTPSVTSAGLLREPAGLLNQGAPRLALPRGRLS